MVRGRRWHQQSPSREHTGILLLRRRTIVVTTSGRIPELPLRSVLARRSIIALTTSEGRGLPTLVAWLRTRLVWRCLISSGGIRKLARAPNPVLTPYIVPSL